MCSSAKGKILTLCLLVRLLITFENSFGPRSGHALDPNYLTLKMVFLNYVFC